MTMIPAQPGMWVRYRDKSNRDELIAWNADGWPMVFTGKRLRPVDPAAIKDIDGPEDSPYEDIVHFTPTDDLRVLYTTDDGSLFDHEVIGWGVTRAGHVVPVGLDGGCSINEATAGNYVTAFREKDREATYAAYTPKES